MRVILFDIFSGIWQHSLLQQQLMNSVGIVGEELTIVGCGNALPVLCTTRENYGLKLSSSQEELKRICSLCKFSTDLTVDRLKPSSNLRLSDYVSESDYEDIESEISKITLAKLQEDNYLKIPYISASLYELVIRYKMRDLNLSEEEFEHFKSLARNYLVSEIASARIIREVDPDSVVIHSPQYAANSAMANVAKREGVKVYFLGSNVNLSELKRSLRIYDWFKFLLINPVPSFTSENLREVSFSGKRRILQHIRTLSKARSPFVYSTPRDKRSTRQVFDIPRNHKIILLAMSSYDEFYAASLAGYMGKNFKFDRVFINQTEWIAETIEWAKLQKDLTLIIRPHPRELPNKRESRSAPRDPRLMQILSNTPENIRVDDGKQKFPIQNYFKEIDGFVVSWSSTAMDALLEEIPVIAYDQSLIQYPRDLVFTGESKSEYFKNLDSLLSGQIYGRPKSLAYSWFDYSQHQGSILLPGRIHDSPGFNKIPFFENIIYRLEKSHWKIIWTLESRIKFPAWNRKGAKKILRNMLDSFYDESF